MITFDEKLEAAWGLHKIEKHVLEKEIAELRAENEKLRESVASERARCLKIAEKFHRNRHIMPSFYNNLAEEDAAYMAYGCACYDIAAAIRENGE